MAWNFESDRPIYTQLMERIELMILSGTFPVGSKLPPVRELAAEAAVNPNTLQKAFSELERKGLVFTQRTSGRFITENPGVVESLRRQLADEEIQKFFLAMKRLGYSKDQVLQQLCPSQKEAQQ